MSPSLQEQLQGVLGDAYVLERELGGGGMSHVFLALEKALGRRVVVKVLLPELAAGVNIERFRREILLAAQLQHPHIVPLLAAGEAGHLPYFIMPFVTGESLRARMAREGELPVAETVRILRDVVSALAYAHASGVVHRDVKPDNVLISGGVAVVTDFGVAKAVSASSADALPGGAITSLGVALGTPTYMAPEQATASPQIDHRADLYALGAMAYEMLAGTPPFAGRSPQAMLAAHVMDDPEPVERRRPVVPPMLAALVRSCLAKRPADRPQSATDVLHILDSIATPTSGTVPTTVVQPVPPARHRRLGGLPAAALAAVLLLGGVLWWQSRPAPVATSAAPAPPAILTPDSTAFRAAEPVQEPEPAPAPAAVPAPPVPRAEPPRQRARQRPPAAAEEPATPAEPVDTIRPSRPAPVDTGPAPAAAPVETPAPAPSPAPLTPPAPPAGAAAPAPKPPAPPADPMPEVRALIAAYAGAVEARSVGALKRVYPGMTGVQERGWEQFFQLVREVEADLAVTELQVRNATADARIGGTYTYLNTSTQRTESRPVSFRAALRREAGRWHIVEVE